MGVTLRYCDLCGTKLEAAELESPETLKVKEKVVYCDTQRARNVPPGRALDLQLKGQLDTHGGEDTSATIKRRQGQQKYCNPQLTTDGSQ